MTGTQTQVHDRRMVSEISQLFGIAGRESEVISHLIGGMDQLRAVQAAKHALAELTPAEVRAALDYRRSAGRGAVSEGSGGGGRGQAGDLS